MKTCLLLLALAGCALAAPAEDLVDVAPDYKKTPFNVYSGFITVPGPVAGYDELKIHYQFQEAQNNSAKAPVVTWHQGGPGGSSLYGLYAEMGYFQQSDSGASVNAFAWNRLANMLYLESPAGSGDVSGYSECHNGGKVVDCMWDDVTQGEAYSATLQAFFKKFPELKNNDLYLTGESYAGQYLPNAAAWILQHDSDKLPNFKGIAVGNGCWGGDKHTVDCNGPNEDKNDAELFWGKGLVSKKAYEAAVKACGWDGATAGDDSAAYRNCELAFETLMAEVGPYNIYDIYDNCPGVATALAAANKTMPWLTAHHRKWLHHPEQGVAELKKALGGGYDWLCGGMEAEAAYLTRPDVQKALHLGSNPGASGFQYSTSGPASVTLYPDLIGKIRVLIFNGDSDACVPYKGNEEWTTGMVTQGVVTEKAAWHPWYLPSNPSGIAAGYATSYTPTKGDKDFNFVTIRLAGHMVPTFQPAAGFAMFEKFLNHAEW